MISKKYLWWLHILGCIIFLSVPFFTSHEFTGSISRLSPMLTKDLVQFGLLIIFFYFNFFFLIPKLYFGKKYFLYIVILLVSMWLIAYLPSSFVNADHPQMRPGSMPHFEPKHFGPPHRNFFLSRIDHNFFLFLAVAFFSLLLSISNRWKQTEREKINTELSYLKAQINPHFLFNTLNSIYSLAIQKADTTAPAVQKLSAMMRYVLNDTTNNFVPLQKEIEHISNYIDLQKLRFGKEVQLNYAITGTVEKKDIAPLILIPFIENAFKYGVNAEENSEINIKIHVMDQQLEMLVTNNIVKTQVSGENQSGIGLNNTRDRLNLLYPSRHQLEIIHELKKFTVKLNIELK